MYGDKWKYVDDCQWPNNGQTLYSQLKTNF